MKRAVAVRVPARILGIHGLSGFHRGSIALDQGLGDQFAIGLIPVEIERRLAVAGERNLRQVSWNVRDGFAFRTGQGLRAGDDGQHHEIRRAGRVPVIDAECDGRVDFLTFENIVIGGVRGGFVHDDRAVGCVLLPRAHDLRAVLGVERDALGAQTVAFFDRRAVALLKHGVGVVLDGHGGVEFHGRLLAGIAGRRDSSDFVELRA